MATRPYYPKIEAPLDPADRLLSPFIRFAKIGAAGGLVLIAAAAAGLIWANSAVGESYAGLWEKTYFSFSIGDWGLSKPLVYWINDLLMALFFLLVGLEIKRELVAGELASPRRALIPMVAAVGGMVVPAMVYAAINWGEPTLRGWGVPMATDIAFALGVMALLGDRVPLGVRVFLTSLAIVDDLGALLVIAIFYTEQLDMTALGLAALVMLVLITFNVLRLRLVHFYLFVGLLLWFLVFKSGVHATIAGVLLAATIPVRARVNTRNYVTFTRKAVEDFEADGVRDEIVLTTPGQQGVAIAIEDACAKVEAPLRRLEHKLLPIVAFLIVPIFALSNAGVRVVGLDIGETAGSRVAIGIVAGLLIGKPVGIMLATWIAVRLGLGTLPNGATWRQIHGASWLAGIGFTMALFIANLAFAGTDFLDQAKLAILSASLVAAVVGWALLASSPRPPAATAG